MKATKRKKHGAAKLLAAAVGINAALFSVFYFDLDGRLLYYVVEPFLKKHYDNIERADITKAPYDVNTPKYEYKV
ncbi:MAG: hypothetical protein RR314_06535 [Oscillospiraceae bacterium]